MEHNVNNISRGGRVLRTDTLRSRRNVQFGVRNAGASGGASPSGTTRPGTSSEASVATEVQSPRAAESRGRRRFKWTEEHNTFLYRTYLTITKMESDMKPYSVPLHRAMIERFPELRHKTVQNILDQRRSLFTSHRLPADIVAAIRTDVSRELGLLSTSSSDEEGNAEEAILTSANNPLSDLFAENEILYGGMDPTARPRLPRLITNRGKNTIVGQVDEILKSKVGALQNISELHDVIYIGALTAIKANGQRVNFPRAKKVPQRPPWEERLCRKVDKLRKDIGRLTAFLSSANPTERARSRAESVTQAYKNPENTTGPEVLDLLKQRLMVLSYRLRRYRQSNMRREQDNLFRANQKELYKRLQSPSSEQHQACVSPSKEETMSYWEPLWSCPSQHNTRAAWIAEEKKRVDKIPAMIDHIISLADVEASVKRTRNWKAPGIDGVHNFWYKRFSSTHLRLAEFFSVILQDASQMPTFFTQGMTYLIPKTSPAVSDPSKYRPITCLPTIYKLFTSVLTKKINNHLEKTQVIAEEQKGCRQGSRGCKEQLVIDSVISETAKKNRGNLYTAYIDYRKAFDSVPHSWLVEVLRMYKIDPVIVNCLQSIMDTWCTNLLLTVPGKPPINTGQVKINRGIFQGDALSALWFCLALNPLSSILQRSKKGLTLGQYSFSHLMYMDDIKLISDTEKGVRQLVRLVEKFSVDICMSFGLDKCKVNAMVKGKWSAIEACAVPKMEAPQIMEAMQRGETYRYLGFLQDIGISHSRVKETLISGFKRRTQAVMISELNGSNKVKAINTFAVPVISYSFGVIGWTGTDLEGLNRIVRVCFTRHRSHHPRSSVERFHLSRARGGRGVVDFREVHAKQLLNLRTYFFEKSKNSPLHEVIVRKDSCLTPLRLSEEGFCPLNDDFSENTKVDRWRSMELHGRYYATLMDDAVDENASVAWLEYAELFAETEGLVIAIQDRVVSTLNYRKHIIKDPAVTSDLCRLCNSTSESIEHVVSGCQYLAPKEYTVRHNNVAKILHQKLALDLGLLDLSVPYFKYTPQSVLENDGYRLYYDRTILTDRTVEHNRPDIVLVRKQDKTTWLIDVAIPLSTNISRTYTEKITKYRDLADQVKEIWDQSNVTIVPIILGAMGEIPHSLRRSLQSLGISANLFRPMQKAVLLDTCRMVRRYVTSENQSITPANVDEEQ